MNGLKLERFFLIAEDPLDTGFKSYQKTLVANHQQGYFEIGLLKQQEIEKILHLLFFY